MYEGLTDVCVDVNVAQLVTQEALSNARKYGDGEHPIRIVSEIIRESRNDTPKLHLTVSNFNKPGMQRLSDEECIAVFKSGCKASGASSTSDGLGLDNAFVAVQAAHGRIWLSTSATSMGTQTHLHCEFPIGDELPLQSPVTALQVHGKNASELAHNDGHRVDLSANRDNEDEQLANNSNALDEVTATDRAPLVCLGLDDTLMLRKMHMLLFKLFMGADMTRSGSLGATRDEITHFVDVVMGRRDLSLRPARTTPADVVLIDQNLCDDDDTFDRGEDIALRLREEQFAGVICVLTGSNTEELERLSRLPHVDVVLEKGTDLLHLSRLLKERARPYSRVLPLETRVDNT